MNKKINILSVIGTRPEAIKMAPIIKALEQDSRFNPILCVTGQHREMLKSMLAHFSIEPDFHLDIMKSAQGLSDLTCAVLSGLDKVLDQTAPDILLVQGDTTTVMAASIAALYKKIPIGHVEAGLRTGDIYSPWPEEANRKITGSIATLHFAPTESARQNLLRESVPDAAIHVTGNTVIDALQFTLDDIQRNSAYQVAMRQRHPFLGSHEGFSQGKSVILVTGHRRESFGDGFKNICAAIKRLAARPDVVVIYPVHLNPNVRGSVFEILGDLPNVKLLEPLGYRDFVFFMHSSRIILTDSGGVQEEAPSLQKPVLVMREVTERAEAIHSGAVKLVGTDPEIICRETERLLDDPDAYQRMRVEINPYGDGHASRRILDAIAAHLLTR